MKITLPPIDELSKKLKPLYICTTVSLVSAAIAFLLSIIWAFEIHPIVIICMSILISAYIHFITKNKNGLLLLIFPIAIIILVCIFIKFNPIITLADIFNQSLDYWNGKSEYQALNGYIMTLTATLPITAAVYFIHKRYEARLIMSCLIFAGLITTSVMKQAIPKLAVFSALLYIFSTLIETVILLSNKKRDKKRSQSSALYLFPAALLSVLLVMAIPSSNSPINWGFIKVIYNAACEKAEMLITEIRYIFGNGQWEFSVAGYSDSKSSSLGGGISDNESVLLYVNSVLKCGGNMYLTGAVKDYYDGEKWVTIYNNKTDFSEYWLDYLEFCFFLYNSEISPKDFVYKINSTVIYNQIKTKTLFYPSKTIKITLDDDKKADFTNSGIVYNKARGNKNTYSFSFLGVDYTSEAFYKLVTDKDKTADYSDFSPEDFSKFISDNMGYMAYKNSLTIPEELPKLLKLREDEIYSQFLSLPEAIPKRVYDLADEITKGLETDYDKLKAIESFLSTNYSYTKLPGIVPDGKDAVDYFLFESKQGYCTYFATAMAILARAEGIPTRYVEGVLVDYSETTSPNTYKVKGNNAHAWPECYIEGIGWIPFEPTATYYEKRYTARPKPISHLSADIDLSQYIPDNVTPQEDMPIPNQALIKEAKKQSKAPLVIVITIICIIISAFSYYKIIRYRYKRRIKKADSKGKYRLYFSEILYFYSVLGFNIGESETVIQFADRIAVDTGESIKSTAKTYTKLRFSSAEPNENDYDEVFALLNQTETLILNKKGLFKMIFYKIRLYNLN